MASSRLPIEGQSSKVGEAVTGQRFVSLSSRPEPTELLGYQFCEQLGKRSVGVVRLTEKKNCDQEKFHNTPSFRHRFVNKRSRIGRNPFQTEKMRLFHQAICKPRVLPVAGGSVRHVLRNSPEIHRESTLSSLRSTGPMFYRDLLLRCEWPEWWLTPTTIVGFRRLLEGSSPTFVRAGVPGAGTSHEEALLTWPLTPQPHSSKDKMNAVCAIRAATVEEC